MKPSKLFGKLIYFFGYPVLRYLLHGTTRAYVVLQVGDEVLLTKNWLEFHKKWRLPGGGLKSGEQPLFAVQRELKEELGIAMHERNFIQVNKAAFRHSFNYDYFLFELRLPEKPLLKLDTIDIYSAEFVPIKKLESLPLSEEIANYLELANKK